MVTDEAFFAWLDGELDPAESARVEAEVEADPELAAKAERHRAMRRKLAAAFDPVLAAPVPPWLRELRPVPDVVDLASVRESRIARRWSGVPPWAAVAATLAIGIFVGTMAPHRSDAPVAVEGGAFYAAAALDRGLTTQLASAPTGDIRVGLTFRDQSGAMCRSFTAPAASGLACRDGNRWRLRGLFAVPEAQTGPYRMAAGPDPNLAAMIGSTMSGEPLDAAAEKAARDRNWR
jgi:hypothetical protein